MGRRCALFSFVTRLCLDRMGGAVVCQGDPVVACSEFNLEGHGRWADMAFISV